MYASTTWKKLLSVVLTARMLCVAAIGASALTALAQDDRDRQAGENARATKTKQINLDDVKAVKREKKQTEKAQARVTRNEAFLIATETRLLDEIQKALAFLLKTAERLPKKSTERLQMRDKILNLRLEAAVYHSNQENRRYDKAWEAWDRGGRRGTEPKLDTSRSREQWQRLAQDGESLLAEYPKSPKADETLFNMGLAQNFLGKEKDAARIFSQLIAKYPNSPKAGDAYFALGDFYFDRTDFRNATNNYKNALRFKQARSYAWSLFKLGWCHYNLGQYAQGLAYWKQAVSESSRSGKQGLALKDEALRDMVFGFAELRQIEPAIAYYKRNGGAKYIGRFLLLLSTTLSDQGQYDAAIRVLKRFQQEEAYNEDAPDTQKEIIGLNYELGRMSAVWAELDRFPRLYGPSSAWSNRIKSQNNKRYLEVQQLIKDQILLYAKLTHKNGQKDGNQKIYAEALKGYELFLKNYPKAPEVAEVKYNMADIYYFNKRWRESAKLYLDITMLGKARAIVIDPKSGKKSSIHKESSGFMLESYSLDFEADYKALTKRKPDFTKPPMPLSEPAKNFIRACAIHTKGYPEDKKSVKNCDAIMADIYYFSNDKKNSMQHLWLLAKKYAGDKLGNLAVDRLVPLYKDDKAGLARVSSELRKIPAYQKGQIGTMLKDLEFGSQVDLAKVEKNLCKRGAKYKDLYDKNPNNKDAIGLIYNAAQDYIACGKIAEGISAYLIVIKRFPKDDVAQVSLLNVAKLQEKRLELAQAAAYYGDYAKRYGKDKLAAGAMAKSCELYAAVDSANAVSVCLAFAGVDAQGGKAVLQRMMRAAFSAGDAAKVVSLARTLEGRFKLSADESIASHAMIYNASGGSGVGQQAAQQILSTFRSSGGAIQGEALRAVGGLVFRQVNGEFGRYQALRLNGGTVDALAASIQAKAQGLARLKGAYDQVLATKDPYWGVAALYQMGHAYELFAQDLENPPAIAGAKRDDVIKELAKDAKEARGEAGKFYNMALDAVEKFSVYNEWAAKALSGRARMAGRNINFDDLIVRPDFLGAEVPESVAKAVKSSGD